MNALDTSLMQLPLTASRQGLSRENEWMHACPLHAHLCTQLLLQVPHQGHQVSCQRPAASNAVAIQLEHHKDSIASCRFEVANSVFGF